MATFTVKSENDVNYLEIIMDNETVRSESGTMRYTLGQIEMESKGPSITGFFKSAVTGENIYRPKYSGSGTLCLEPTFYDICIIDLQDESYTIDQGAYLASEGNIEVGVMRNTVVSAVFSAEGLFQTTVKGTGKVAVLSPGPVQEVMLNNDKLVVDGSFAIARSSSLKFSVKKSSKSIIGSITSGEGLVNVIEGTGKVYMAPVPHKFVLLGHVLVSMLSGLVNRK